MKQTERRRGSGRRPAVVLVAGVLAALAPACGQDQTEQQRRTIIRTVTVPKDPAERAKLPPLAREPLKRDEIMVIGNTTPKTYGPYDFEAGPYDVRFEQYAPEAPGTDFEADATVFTAGLNRRSREAFADSKLIVNAAEKRGRTQFLLAGRYYVEVGTADHSYVIRFTPRSPAKREGRDPDPKTPSTQTPP